MESQKVTKSGKKIYHIQNLNICTDGEPFDVFALSDHFPTENDLKHIWHNEFGTNADGLDEFLTSSNIYDVFVEEL